MNIKITKDQLMKVKARKVWGFKPTNRIKPSKKAFNKKKERQKYKKIKDY